MGCSVDEYVFGPDNRTLYVTAQDMGQKGIFAISTSFGEVSKVYADGSAESLNVAGGKIVFKNHRLNAPADIYQMKGESGQPVAITQINADNLKDIQRAEFAQFNFPACK